MNINFCHFSYSSVYFFQESILPALNLQKNKILLIAAIALGCLAACYCIWSCKAKLKSLHSDLEDTDIKDASEDLKPNSLSPKLNSRDTHLNLNLNSDLVGTHEENVSKDLESISLSPHLTTNFNSDKNLPNYFSELPSEMIFKITSLLAVSELGKMAQVNTNWRAFIDTHEDEIWSHLCECEELEPRDSTISWKEHYQKFSSYVAFKDLRCSTRNFHSLKIKMLPHFKQRVEQLDLDQYRLLNAYEIRLLFKKSDTIALMQSASFLELQSCPPITCLPAVAQMDQKNIHTLRYVAQQRVGEINFDIISYTSVIVSFDSMRQLMINNKPTSIFFTEADCQLLVTGYKNHLYIENKDRGDNEMGEMVKLTYSDFL